VDRTIHAWQSALQAYASIAFWMERNQRRLGNYRSPSSTAIPTHVRRTDTIFTVCSRPYIKQDGQLGTSYSYRQYDVSVLMHLLQKAHAVHS
jgi:hypothetical protein